MDPPSFNLQISEKHFLRFYSHFLCILPQSTRIAFGIDYRISVLLRGKAGCNPEIDSEFDTRASKKRCQIARSCRLKEGEACTRKGMSRHNPGNKKQLNLAEAIRIIQNAGLPDPQTRSDNPDDHVQGIIDALCTLSTHDGLTGLVNAVFFHAILSREIDRSLRTGRTCGLVVIDIDHFKQINDTYGHGTGDQVLQAIARQMQLNLRNMDTAARIGGEEFAVILPECTPRDAISAATRIHHDLNPMTVPLGQNTLQLTTSAGLVWTNPNIQVNSSALLSEADLEMYRAKRSGRGRLCYGMPEVPHVSRQERSALMDLQLGEGFHGH